MDFKTIFDGHIYTLQEFTSPSGDGVMFSLQNSGIGVGTLYYNDNHKSACIIDADFVSYDIDYWTVSRMTDYDDITALIVVNCSPSYQ
jgi:hypothetical protein